MSKNKYTKELLQTAANKSYSIADMCREFKLKPVGNNYETIVKKCKEFGVDISHFVGQDWHKSSNTNSNLNKLEDILQENTHFKSSQLKKRLIEAGLKKDECEICGCSNQWQGKPITLELHHINGNHNDNRLENLQILCPNCHSQQESHRIPKIKHTLTDATPLRKYREELKKCTCLNCGKEFKSDRLDRTRKFCSVECYREYIQKFGNKEIQESVNHSSISLDDLKREIPSCNTIADLSRKLNSHRCTIREYLIRYGLYEDFKKKNKAKQQVGESIP